jgi:hypothetical protein
MSREFGRSESSITETELSLAKCILRAWQLREESYDDAAADIATAAMKVAAEAWERVNPDMFYPNFINYNQFYKMTLKQAAAEAAAEAAGLGIGVGQLVFLALDGWANDVIEWAERIIDPMATCVPTEDHCQHGMQYSSGTNEFQCDLCDALAASRAQEKLLIGGC